MRKIGVETTAYFRLDGAEAGFRQMKEDGFDCADYQLDNTEIEPYTLDDSAFEARLAEHRKAVEAAGVEIYQVHGPWRYPPRDATPEDRAERLEKMKRCLWGASFLGASCMAVHPIMPFGPDANPDPACFHDLNLAFYSELCETAKQAGVTVCLENMPFHAHSIARPSEILRFVKEIGSDFMAVCLDTGHCAVLGVSPADAIREAGQYIRCVHIHDNDGRGDQHRLPYDGVIDWADFIDAMNILDTRVPFSLETKPSQKLPPAIYRYMLKGYAALAREMAGNDSTKMQNL